MKKIKKRLPSRSKKPKRNDKFDEEISEDEDIIDDLDVGRNKKGKINNEGGELWKYIHDSYGYDEPDEEGTENTDLPPINLGKKDENEETRSENDFSIDRLEESVDLSGTILDYDQLEEDDPSYKWITQSNESNETYKKLVKKFKQVEADVPKIFKAESQARTKRLERKTQYESVKKHLTKKWAPIVSQINKTEGIVYGEETERSDATCGTLYSTFKPETDLEKELAKSSDEKLKLIEGKALAKAVLAREQKKNKRINRIKSKRWHKRQKQRDLEIAAKLLTKIDDPDLANEIKSTFERKRAEKRILRKKEAQSKWAKMALRYGGKDLLKEISFQNQNLRNDHQLIDEVSKFRKKEDEGEDEDDSDISNDEGEELRTRETNQDKLNVILDSSVPIPEKGLFNLTFMKNAIENRRLQEKNENEKSESDEGDDGECEEDYDQDHDGKMSHQKRKDDDEEDVVEYNVIVNDEGVEVDSQIVKLNKLKEDNAVKFSKHELEKAREELNRRFFSDQFSEFDKVEDKTTAKLKSIAYDTSIFTDKSNTQPYLSEDEDEKQKRNEDYREQQPDEHDHHELTKKKKKKHQDHQQVNIEQGKQIEHKVGDKKDEIDGYNEKMLEIEEKVNKRNKVVKVDSGLDEFIDLIHEPKENENEKYVKEMFVTRPEDENYIEDSEDEKDDDGDGKKSSMAGWGSWTGYGIENEVKNKEKEEEEKGEKEREKHKKPRVKVSKRKDPKLSKYYIHNLPHPFNNRHEYNSKMEIPLGPEWNTMNMHKKLIQPKTSVKIGSVIMPLGLGNNKHKQLIRDYGKKIAKNRTHSRL
ncbi:hypothetical protein MACK_003334 [Theileria orientalis]|uniref:U3 small nucleolar RNA-associated protein n=1 Tax=Theileria orientalis TaxID=68886 RepID=A0A976SIJ5_THEOR|nr:hypothetical protein MACK_003334 [Theileria orientalis]